jgi:hypothetical protein
LKQKSIKETNNPQLIAKIIVVKRISINYFLGLIGFGLPVPQPHFESVFMLVFKINI